MITNTIDRCPECSHDSIITDFIQGRIVCAFCGFVLKERIVDESYEGRNFNNENSQNRDQSRVGAPINSVDENNMSLIVAETKHGSMLNQLKNRNNIGSCNSSQKRTQEIKAMGEKMRATTAVVNRAIKLMKTVEDNKKMKGRNMKFVITALFFMAFRYEKQAMKLDKIAELAEITDDKEKKKIKKYLTVINNCLSRVSDRKTDSREIVHTYISTFFNKKDNISEIENAELYLELAKEISLKMHPFLEGCHPNTISGLSLLLGRYILEEKIAHNKIYENTIKKETLNKNYINKIYPYLDKIIPEKYKDKICKLPTSFP